MSRIAYASPMPPAPTGIATYSASVLEGLEQIGFTSEQDVDVLWPLPDDAGERVRDADAAVYHIGNNVEFHGGIYGLAVRHPGVVVLHDLALDGLIWGLGERKNPLAEPARAEGLAAAGSPGWREEDWEEPLQVPWCAQVTRRARALIVHGEFGRTYLRAFGCRTPAFVAPHPLVEQEEAVAAARARRDEMRAPFRSSGDEFLVGIAGDLNASKGIEETLQALGRIAAPVHLLLVGRVSPHWDVQRTLRESGQASRVTVVSDAPDEEFLAWLCAMDVVVNLRYPHRGEASGSLLRAFQAGVPSIVSGVGTYLDWPDDMVLRIRPGRPDPEELARKLALLAEDPALRRTYGERARSYVLETCRPEATARVYERAIRAAATAARGAVASSARRWAEALAECGAGPETLARGYGARFADALDELLRPERPASEERAWSG